MTDDYEPFEIHDDESSEGAEPPVVDVDPSAGIPWGMIAVFVGVALIVVFAVQNTGSVEVRFLWMEGQFPLAIVILVTAGVSILLGELMAIVYRRRRRKRRRALEVRRYEGWDQPRRGLGSRRCEQYPDRSGASRQRRLYR